MPNPTDTIAGICQFYLHSPHESVRERAQNILTKMKNFPDHDLRPEVLDLIQESNAQLAGDIADARDAIHDEMGAIEYEIDKAIYGANPHDSQR